MSMEELWAALSDFERAVLIDDSSAAPPLTRPMGGLSHIVLGLVASDAGLQPSQIADRLGLSRAATSRVLGKLEDRGYVTRSVSSQDARGRIVQVEHAGAAALHEQDLARARALDLIFAGWPPSDVADLVRLLNRLNNSVASAHRTGASQPPTTEETP